MTKTARKNAAKSAGKPTAIFTIAEAAKLTNTSFFLVGDLARKGLLTIAGGGKKQGCRIGLGPAAVVALAVVRELRERKYTRGEIRPISLFVCQIGDAKFRSAFRGGKTALLCWLGTFQPPKLVSPQAASKAISAARDGAAPIAIDLAAILVKLLEPSAQDSPAPAI